MVRGVVAMWILGVVVLGGCEKASGPTNVSSDTGTAKPPPAAESVLVDGRPVKAWAKDLRQPEAVPRSKTVAAVGKLGEDAKPLVPILTKMLADEQPELRITAAQAIARLGPIAKETVPALIANLKDPNQRVRLAVITALGNMREEAKSALPALQEGMKGPDAETADAIAQALVKIGPAAAPTVLELIKSGKVTQRPVLGDALALIGKESVESVVPGLKDPDPNVREWSAYALSKLGPTARPAQQALLDTLNDSSVMVREHSSTALAGIGRAAVSALAESLKSKQANVRFEASKALNKMAWDGIDLSGTSAALIETLLDQDAKTSQYAANSLNITGVGPEAKASVGPLLEASKSKDMMIRTTAVVMLGGIGPDAKIAIPQLLEYLTDTESQMRSAAAKALSRIGPDAKVAVAPLTKALKDPDPYVRRSAVLALAGIGLEAKSVVPAVRECQADKQGYVAVAVAGCLARLSPEDAKTSMDLLAKAAADPNRYVRNVAVDALREVGVRAVPLLADRLGDPDHYTRLHAARALRAVGPEAKEATPKLLAALKNDRDRVVRRAVINALKAIDPEVAAKAGAE